MMSQLLNSAVFPGIQGGPLEHVIAAKAVAFYEALQPEFKAYAKQVKKNAPQFPAMTLYRPRANRHCGVKAKQFTVLSLLVNSHGFFCPFFNKNQSCKQKYNTKAERNCRAEGNVKF